jgi:hypothetical protein
MKLNAVSRKEKFVWLLEKQNNFFQGLCIAHFFQILWLMINLSQQFYVLGIIFPTKPPGLGLKDAVQKMIFVLFYSAYRSKWCISGAVYKGDNLWNK